MLLKVLNPGNIDVQVEGVLSGVKNPLAKYVHDTALHLMVFDDIKSKYLDKSNLSDIYFDTITKVKNKT